MGAHGGNIRESIENYRLKNKKFIDFSANINPLGLSSDIKNIILSGIKNISHYPDPESSVVKESLSSYLKVPQDNLLIGNGSAELIFLLNFALRPKRALIPIPTFNEYERAVSLAGGKCIFLDAYCMDNCQSKITAALKKLRSGDLIFICNPNNPTGSLFKKEEINFLAHECEKRMVILLIDEVFMDFVADKNNISMFMTAAKKNHILVLGSLTKFFAIPGLRLGYLAAGKELIKRISFFQPPWPVNYPAQLIGSHLLRNTEFIEKSRLYMFRQRNDLFAELKKINYLKPYQPNANFIFCKILSNRFNSRRLSDYCGKRGIFIRDCANFRGLDDSFIRVAVRKKEENRELIKVLKEWQSQ